MKSKLFVLLIIIAIVAMSMVVIMALAARRSFLISSEGGDLGKLEAQPIGANQRLTEFYGEVELYLNNGILGILDYGDRVACIKKCEDQLTNPIEGVVQIEKEKGKGDDYSFRFKWDESTKLLESVGCTGDPDFTEQKDGTITGNIIFNGSFTLKVLLGDEHQKTGRIHRCDWHEMGPVDLSFTIELKEL